MEPPLCRSTINWGVTTDVSIGDPAPGIALGTETESTNSTVFVDWKVAALTNYTQAVSEKNCRIGSGTIKIGAVVKVGLDVTNDLGTTGPNGNMHDAGDDLSHYLPGYVGENPVIRWDKYTNRLIPQHLQIRVETLGGSWTNAKISLGSVTTMPGWCTNTRVPGEKDDVAVWFPEDFSLAQDEFLNEVYLPLGEEDTVAVADLYCRDYGGTCKVKVELFGEGGTTFARTLTIPRDDDNDGIADCWEEAAKAEWETRFATNIVEAATIFIGSNKPTEPADPDGNGPLAAHYGGGDGLSVFEEYRGYSLPGTGSAGGVPHVRFSPAWKEMILQVDVVSTNGVPVVPLGVASNLADRAASVFLRDLGIRLHWYMGAGFERESYAGRTLEDVHSVYAAGRAAAAPPMHNARGVRRLVLTTGFPPQENGTKALGIANRRCAIVDIGGALRQFSPTDSWHWFLARHGVLPGQAVLRVVLHESGHMAGVSGDEELLEAEPALRIRSRVADQDDCAMWVADRLDERCFYLRHPLDIEDEAYVILGEAPLTVAAVAAQINANSLLFFAEVARPDAGGKDAARLSSGFTRFPSTTGVWRDVYLEAAVNGVMTYNKYNPAVWKAPAFDNAAAAEQENPLARLYAIEVGSVLVTPVHE